MFSVANSDTPWTAERCDDGFYRVVNSKSIVIAQKCVKEEAELFAAAPELEEALEALLDAVLDGRVDDLDEKEARARELADIALTKAHGNAA